MATDTVLAPHDVSTRLNYYTPIGTEAPYRYRRMEPPAGKPRDNIGKDWREVVVHDVRGREQEFSLDENGFQFINWRSAEKDFDDEERIREHYYHEVEELLKNVTGARRVHVFNHLIRRQSLLREGKPDFMQPPVPRFWVHVDQIPEQCIRHVNKYSPHEAEQLLKGRVRIINVWRSIHNPVAHHPLGVSDWRYLDERDYVSVRTMYPSGDEKSIYTLRYNPEHRWYYLSSQTPEEVTLIKIYDSAVDRAKCAPHSAFVDESSPKEAPERESIEIRALVFDSE